MKMPEGISYWLRPEPLFREDDGKTFWITLGLIVAISCLFCAIAGKAMGAELLPHPRGCPPRAFCACGAAVDLFGAPVRALWPSAAWFKFPRTAPRPNTVAVRRGHVFVLKRHVRGTIWMVNDYNSGGRKSRHHARSIAGYVIVDPQARVRLAAFAPSKSEEREP